MKTTICLILVVIALGIAGEMDYADACRRDAHCHYDGWATWGNGGRHD